MTPKQKAKEFLAIAKELCIDDEENIRKIALQLCDTAEQALTEYGRETDELQNMDGEFRFWDKVREDIREVKTDERCRPERIDPDSPKNWKADYADGENQYVCTCVSCRQRFYGYKHRVICAECEPKYRFA